MKVVLLIIIISLIGGIASAETWDIGAVQLEGSATDIGAVQEETVAVAGVIKTLNGVAFGSVKTYQGVAIGSIKTINGVATQ